MTRPLLAFELFAEHLQSPDVTVRTEVEGHALVEVEVFDDAGECVEVVMRQRRFHTLPAQDQAIPFDRDGRVSVRLVRVLAGVRCEDARWLCVAMPFGFALAFRLRSL